MQKIILKIDEEKLEWLDLGGIECYVLSPDLSKDFVIKFKEKAKKQDKIVLTCGEKALELCKKFDLDGAVIDLSTSEKIKFEMDKAREEIGGKFLGVITRARRHEAMIASENEPEFVIFKIWREGSENLKELVDWYLEFFLLQLALFPQDDAGFEQFNADIVILDTKKYKILVDKK